VVGEVHLEDVADARLEGGARDLTVEPPRARGDSRDEFPVRLARIEVEANDLATRVGLCRFGCAAVGDERVPGWSVNGRAVSAVSVMRVTVIAVVVMFGHEGLLLFVSASQAGRWAPFRQAGIDIVRNDRGRRHSRHRVSQREAIDERQAFSCF
jgi:hypothetical protein